MVVIPFFSLSMNQLHLQIWWIAKRGKSCLHFQLPIWSTNLIIQPIIIAGTPVQPKIQGQAEVGKIPQKNPKNFHTNLKTLTKGKNNDVKDYFFLCWRFSEIFLSWGEDKRVLFQLVLLPVFPFLPLGMWVLKNILHFSYQGKIK